MQLEESTSMRYSKCLLETLSRLSRAQTTSGSTLPPADHLDLHRSLQSQDLLARRCHMKRILTARPRPPFHNPPLLRSRCVTGAKAGAPSCRSMSAPLAPAQMHHTRHTRTRHPATRSPTPSNALHPPLTISRASVAPRRVASSAAARRTIATAVERGTASCPGPSISGPACVQSK